MQNLWNGYCKEIEGMVLFCIAHSEWLSNGGSRRNTSQGDSLLGQPKSPLKFEISLWTVENLFDLALFPAYNSLSFQT